MLLQIFWGKVFKTGILNEKWPENRNDNFVRKVHFATSGNLIVKISKFPHHNINTFAASYLNTKVLNNSCLKSPASTLVDLTFQSRALRSALSA